MILQEQTTLRYHKDLNEKLWVKNALNPDVRDRLLEIANMWAESAGIKPEDIHDIVMTGGNANYNYTDQSDIDVHLIVDYSKFGDIAKDFFMAKKSSWQHSHPNLKIKGYPVELFAQNIADKFPDGQGVYSLTKNEWVQHPEYRGLDLENDTEVELTSKEISNRIKVTVNKDRGLDVANQLATDIYQMRSEGIAKEGEFSKGTLIFKELRNLGLLEKLKNYISKKEDQKLSLE